MMISTRGRYALRVMVDLAEHDSGKYIPLKEIAGRQEISQKYLEGIMTSLSKANLVDGAHGKGGGYRLIRRPENYPVGEILRLTEGSLAPVSCLEEKADPCQKSAECRTLPMWEKLNTMINGFFDSVSVADLMNPDADGENIKN